MEISAADALTWVKTECNTSASPEVADAKVEDILTKCKMPDEDGRLVSDTLWTESYDLNRACALVWEYRTGLCFTKFDVEAGPNKQARSQIVKHCRQQARLYRARLAHSFDPGTIDKVQAAQLPTI